MFYYALYQGETEIVDDYGNATGQYAVNYSEPVQMSANVSAARGTADAELFGINTAYSKTIVTDELECPIAEDSIIWLGVTPDENGESGEIKHNYAVTAIGKSINSITYAIREVTAS